MKSKKSLFKVLTPQEIEQKKLSNSINMEAFQKALFITLKNNRIISRNESSDNTDNAKHDQLLKEIKEEADFYTAEVDKFDLLLKKMQDSHLDIPEQDILSDAVNAIEDFVNEALECLQQKPEDLDEQKVETWRKLFQQKFRQWNEIYDKVNDQFLQQSKETTD